MARGFKWKLGDFIGGTTAVHQAYKPYLAIQTPGHSAQAVGEFLIQPADTSDLVVTGLGFTPTAVVLASYRPQLANGISDAAFGARGGGMTFGVASASAQFTGSTRIRHAFETPQARWREDVAFNVIHKAIGVDVLTLSLASLDADGFTLSQDLNLYDQTDYVAWLALGGNIEVGVFDAGDTSVGSFAGTPGGAMFLSTKNLASQPYRSGYWDHMVGFASDSGSQATIWGGRRPTSWDWTTERWEDDAAILFCDPASGSFFAGTAVKQKAIVSAWVSGGVDLSWPIFDGQPYRIGYLFVGTGEAGVVETSWETRPTGAYVDADGNNIVSTTISPDAILMAATNYNFDRANVNPYDMPRSAGAFWKGGSGGLGWHAKPYSEAGYDAYGVHTYGNAVAEFGHYANSGTQYLRRYILAGQGGNSNPPAYHQHSVNVVAAFDEHRTQMYRWIPADRH